MELWALLVWLAIGAAAGFVAHRLMGESRGGLLGDLVMGILGSVVGGYALSVFGRNTGGGPVATFVVALIGAMALIWIVRKLRK